MILTFLAAACLSAGQSPRQMQSITVSSTGTSEVTAEGSEIMRRVLVDALDRAFQRKEERESTTRVEEYHRRSAFVTTLMAGHETVQHSRVFHLPGAGLFFSLDASLPVVAKERDDEPRDDRLKDDEWERARKQLNGEGDTRVWLLDKRKIKEAEIDPRAIDQTVDLVLRTVARHAARIEGLAPQETITIGLRLCGRGQAFWDSSSWSDGETEPEGEKTARIWQGEEEGQLAQTYGFVIASSSSAPEQNLVIRIGVGDLTTYGEGGLERLRQRAQVNRY